MSKMNKEARPDGILIKLLVALDCFGIDKLTDIINEIYDISGISEDLSRCNF